MQSACRILFRTGRGSWVPRKMSRECGFLRQLEPRAASTPVGKLRPGPGCSGQSRDGHSYSQERVDWIDRRIQTRFPFWNCRLALGRMGLLCFSRSRVLEEFVEGVRCERQVGAAGSKPVRRRREDPDEHSPQLCASVETTPQASADFLRSQARLLLECSKKFSPPPGQTGSRQAGG